MSEFDLWLPGVEDGECRGCGKNLDESRHLNICGYWKQTEKILKKSRKRDECPERCGRFTVCESCAELSPWRCQRCEMFFREEGRWKKSESENFDYRCPSCSQPHLKKVSDEDVPHLIPVDPEGNPIECKKFPGTTEKDVCECCGKVIQLTNNHREDCVYWTAYNESKEMEKTVNQQQEATNSDEK